MAKISRFYAPLLSLFASFFKTLANAFMQGVGFSRVISELYIPRLPLVLRHAQWIRAVVPHHEWYSPSKLAGPNISLLFYFTRASKIATDFSERVGRQTVRMMASPTLTPLQEIQVVEEATKEGIEPSEPLEERREETGATAPSIIEDFQNRLELALSPSVRGLISAVQGYRRTSILIEKGSFPVRQLTKPFEKEIEAPTSHPLAVPENREPSQVSLPERPSAGISSVSISEIGLKPEAARTFMYAARLPSVLFEQQDRTLSHIEATVPPSTSATALGRVVEEISPALTSWIYGESEVLRGTSLSLSAVPIAASAAQRIMTEALIQPVSSVEPSFGAGVSDQFLGSTVASRTGPSIVQDAVEAFKLPSILTSIVAAQGQRYSLPLTEPEVNESYRTHFEVPYPAAEQLEAGGEITRVQTYSKLPTVIALAAAENVIAQKLHHEFAALIKGIQTFRLSYGKPLGEISGLGLMRTTILGKLAAEHTLSPNREPFPLTAPAHHLPPLKTSGAVSPTIQNNFHITVSAESAEEDLRDLENKINKILAEQVRRYYGSLV